MAKFIRRVGIKGFLKALTFFIFSFCLLILFIHFQTQECSSIEDSSATISPLFGVSLQDSLSELTSITFIKDYTIKNYPDFITWDYTCPPCFLTQSHTCPPCFVLTQSHTCSNTCPPCYVFTQSGTCSITCPQWFCSGYFYEKTIFDTLSCPFIIDIEEQHIYDPLLINQWEQLYR